MGCVVALEWGILTTLLRSRRGLGLSEPDLHRGFLNRVSQARFLPGPLPSVVSRVMLVRPASPDV